MENEFQTDDGTLVYHSLTAAASAGAVHYPTMPQRARVGIKRVTQSSAQCPPRVKGLLPLLPRIICYTMKYHPRICKR